MRNLATICAVAVVLAGMGGTAKADMFNFDSVATGTYTEEALSALVPGASLDNTGGSSFIIEAVSLNPDFSGNAVRNNPCHTQGNSTVATFDVASTFVSVTMGDYGVDPDSLYLNAYDAGNILVDSDFYANPASSYAGHTLSVSGNIARVEFYGESGTNNSVYWDNLNFDPVPVPGAVLLGILGLSVVGVKLRKYA